MTELAQVAQGVQIGVESTPGTAVSAGTKLVSLSMKATVAGNVNVFAASGNKYPSVTATGQEYSEWTVEGQPTFDELPYLFCSALVNATPSTSDTTAKTWIHAPAVSTEDTVKTYTVEEGSATRAHKAAYVIFGGFEMEFTREGISLSGSAMGRQLQDGITMTASPTTPALVPLLPADTSVYLDTSNGTLGTTRLTRVTKVVWRVQDRFAGVWPLDDTQDSYAAHVEVMPTAEIDITLQADSTGLGLALSRLRDNATRFLRLETVSSTLAGAASAAYKFTLDAAVKVGDVPNLGEGDAVYEVTVPLKIVYDGTWTKSFQATVVNKLSAL